MYINNELEEILHVNSVKYKNMSIIFLAIYLTINMISAMMFDEGVTLINIFIKIYYLIASFCCVLLIYSTMKIFKSKLLMILSFSFINIIFINTYFISEIINNRYLQILSISATFEYISSYIIIFGMLIALRYIKNINLNYKIYVLISNIIVLILIITCKGGYKYKIIYIGISLIIFFLITIEVIKFIKNKEYKKKTINYININIILIFLVNLFMLISYFYKNIFILEMIKLIFFLNFSLWVFFTLENILDTPYKILFSKLYKSNEDLDYMNKELFLQNTELEFSQNLIRKKEIMFKDFFKNIPVPVIILSDFTLRIIYCNKSFLKFINENSIKKIINKKLDNLISVQAFENEIKSNLSKEVYSGIIKNKDEKRYINIKVIDRNIENGEIILTFSDITSNIRMNIIKYEMENKILQESLKRDFLSNISHDLKTPINVIYSALQLEDIFIKEKDGESLMKYNRISKSNCFTLMKITNNLIDNSKIQSDHLIANKKRINIVEFTEDTISALVCYAKEKNINIIFDTNKEEVYLDLDESFMQRVLLNLISNSIKFTKSDGRIDVMILDGNKSLRIIVKDNGIGMNNDFIEKIFKKYSMGENNTETDEKGSGIGLFVVKNLVELQGGSIMVKSKIGKGTEVIITFGKGELSDK